uniref:Secreted protein n=1 Tax=Daphnia galeata TaxID=27404 RepID=A0A8J2RWX7_9CRUS|nr:unnamed protein product [Daphnia galeata]
MKRIVGLVNCWTVLLHALLLVVLSPGFNSTQLHLDEVIGDVVEKLFGAVVQDEFTDLIDNCPDASTALKKTEECISDRNLSYQRLNQLASSSSSDAAPKVKQLCDDLLAAGKCLESVIDALKSCSDGDTKQIQRQNIVAVGNGLDASLQYFCKDSGNKLNQFFKQGLPQCFIRRPGRHLARCFPGRITGQASDRHRNNNYWGIIGEEHDFFNAHNCQLLKNHTACAVDTLQKCSSGGVDVFQGAIDIVMDELMCFDEKTELQQNSKSGGTTSRTTPLLYLLMMPIFALIITSYSSIPVGILPTFSF